LTLTLKINILFLKLSSFFYETGVHKMHKDDDRVILSLSFDGKK
jgi:hypothetical protein